MKRSIAAILSLAVVMGMCGCTSKNTDETRTERTTKKTTATSEPDDTDTTDTEETETSDSETEETTTETDETTKTTTKAESSETSDPSESETSETSDTSETSETSETKDTKASDTSDTTATTTAPKDYKKFTVSHDLEHLNVTHEKYYKGLGELVPAAGDKMAYAKLEQSLYSFYGFGYDTLKNLMESIYDGRASMLSYKYDEKASVFHDTNKNLDNDNFYDKGTYSAYSRMYISRADSQIFSCSFVDNFDDDSGISHTYLNFDSNTAKDITFSDVVTDKKMFTTALSDYIRPTDGDDTWQNEQNKRFNAALQELIKEIDAGDDVSFALYYNAIELIGWNQDDASYPVSIMVSVAPLEACVNMDLFGATPKNYSLISDSNENFWWDFDEDGVADKISFTANDSTLEFMFNNTPTSIEITTDLYADDGYEAYCLVSSANGKFLYIQGNMEDPTNEMLIFRLNGEKFEFVSESEDFTFFPFDPSNCEIANRCDIMGTGYMSITASITTNDGKPLPIDPFYFKDGIGITTKKMTLGKYHVDGPFATDETITIPKGTPVMLLGINSEYEMAVLITLNDDESKNEMFFMACFRDQTNQYDDYDYEIHYDGESSYQLFTGPMYAD